MKNIQYNKKTGEILGEVAWNRSQDDDVVQVEDSLWDSLVNPKIDTATKTLVEGPTLPAPELTVPFSVTNAQARVALIKLGLFAEVDAAVQAIPGVDGDAARARWEYAGTIERSDPLVEAIRVLLGWTSTQIDDLFRSAAAE